jgi:predicted PurR-regulated permease PerM
MEHYPNDKKIIRIAKTFLMLTILLLTVNCLLLTNALAYVRGSENYRIQEDSINMEEIEQINMGKMGQRVNNYNVGASLTTMGQGLISSLSVLSLGVPRYVILVGLVGLFLMMWFLRRKMGGRSEIRKKRIEV